MAELNAKAAEMFAAGESVNAVAKALFSGAWAKGKQQYNAWVAATGGAPSTDSAPKKRGRKAATEAEGEAEATEDPERFDLGVTVDTANLGRLFGTFTVQEQASAVAGVIQDRMNALLAD